MGGENKYTYLDEEKLEGFKETKKSCYLENKM